MNNETLFETIQVRSLREIDALVGSRITNEKPLTRWEDSRTEVCFETVEDALDSLHDPHFSRLSSEEAETPAVITEIKEYRRYTRDLDAAWSIVDQHTDDMGPLVVRREDGAWLASFGSSPMVESATAPLAISTAALLARGIMIDCRADLHGKVRLRRTV